MQTISNRKIIATADVNDDPGFWEWLKKKHNPQQEETAVPLYAELPLPPSSHIEVDREQSPETSNIAFEVDISYVIT